MAGLFGLKILLLWAGIIGLASCQSPADSRSTTNTSAASPAKTPPSNTTKPTDPQANTTQSQTSPALTTPNNTVTPTTQATTQAPPQCSYNVAPITSGFRIDMMTSSTPGNYIINITDKGRNKTTVQPFNETSHRIKHLKPCTEYELSVAYRDDAGNKTLCTSTQSKMKTTGMNETDIKEGSCMPRYVCYQSDWDISSSLSTSNNIPAVPCKSSNTELCIKPDYKDICTVLTTTFTSVDCANTFSLTKSITVADFLDPNNITQEPPTGLPAKIEAELPKNCTDLTVDYTCQDELGNNKSVSELEPFTHYNCTGHIKHNSVTINQTKAIKVMIDCDLTGTTEPRKTNTSIVLTWTATSKKCPDLPGLPELSYDCSCVSPSKHTHSVPADKSQTGGMCRFTGLDPFSMYKCTVQPKYNDKNVARSSLVEVRTKAGNDIKALIARLVVFIIASVALVVVVYKIYIPWHKKSRNDANDDMVLESTEDYVNVPQHEHHC